jgi:adenosylhomocysteine nucleosidase
MLLIFYAFAREIAVFKRRLEQRSPLLTDGLRGFRGILAGVDLAAVATGIGPAQARDAAHRAFNSFTDVDLVILTGVAGALSPGLGIGDIVVADRLITADDEDGAPVRSIEVDPEHVAAVQLLLTEAGLTVSSGGILTSPNVLATPEAKRQARQYSGAIAVDMESASIAHEAATRGMSFVCIRAVMDGAGDEVIGADMADLNGRVRPWKAAAVMIREPSVLLRMPRVVRNLSAATRSLADAIATVVKRIA